MKTLRLCFYLTVALMGLMPLPWARAQAGLPEINLPAPTLTPLDVEAQPGHNRPVMALAFSPDGSLLATAGQDFTIRLWDTRSGAIVKTLVGHTAGVTGLLFTPDGRTLISVASVTYPTHADNTIRLWDVGTGELKRALEGASFGSANSIALSSDGKLLAGGGGSADKKIRIWDLQTEKVIATLTGHSGSVMSLAFSHDGSLLASGGGGSDTGIKLWDTQTGQVKATLTGHGPGGVLSLVFSPEDRTLLSGSNDLSARLWDVASGKELRKLVHYENVTRALFSPDGSYVVTVGRLGYVGLLFWETATGKQLGKVPGAWYAADFSPDGATLAYANGNSARLWDVQARQDTRVLRGSTPLHAMALSHQGNLIATGDNDGNLRLWTAREGTLRRAWSGHKGRINSLAFSPDDAWLLSGSVDGVVSLWNVETGQSKWTQQAHESGVKSVAFAGTRHVLSTAGDAWVRVVLRETGKTIPLPNGGSLTLPTAGSAGVIAVSSPPGNMDPLLAVAAGNEIVLRDIDDFKVVHTLRGHTKYITDLAFSADGRQLASVSDDKTARLWDVAGGQMIRQLAALDRPFYSVAMASSGMIALGWGDLRLVKADGQATMPSLQGTLFRNKMVPMPGTFNALRFSPDGKFLYTASDDGAVRVWGVSPTGTLRAIAQMWPVVRETAPPNGEPAYVTVTADGSYVASPNAVGQVRFKRGNKTLPDEEVKALLSPDTVKISLSG